MYLRFLMKKVFIIALAWLVLQPSQVFAQADLTDFQPNQEDFYGQNFSLDAGGEAGAGDVIQLEFGALLGEYLQFDVDTDRFELSNDLLLEGELDLEGNTITIDADNTGVGADVTIVAEQGTDNNGTLRYNATDNQWEISNDGGAFVPIPVSATGEYFDAYDSAGATDVTTGFTDIPLGTERTKTTDFTHTVPSAEVTVNTTETYLVHMSVSLDEVGGNSRSESEIRLMIDTGSGFTVVPGSVARIYNRNNSQGAGTASRSFALDLNAGDVLKMQASRVSGGGTIETLAGGSALVIARVEGVGAPGPQGPQGVPGPGNTLDEAYDQGGAGAGATVTADSGAVVITGDGLEVDNIALNDNTISSLDTNGSITLDPDGTGDVVITSNDWSVDASGAVDASGLSSSGTIDFSAASDIIIPTTESNTFVLDSDDTGGDVVLQFGTSLAEQLFWDESELYFFISDALVVDGNINVQGDTLRLDSANTGAGNDVTILAEQGTDSDGTLSYDAAQNRWEISNDGGGSEAISSDLDSAYDAFDATASTITVDAAEGQTGGLTLDGSLASDETLTVTNSGNGGTILVENTGTGSSLRVNDSPSDSTPFVVNDIGSVGIGNASPGHALDVEGNGQLLELGDSSANDVTINFDDGADRLWGWDDSLGSFSSFDQEVSLRVQQGSTPPEACAAPIAGKFWHDTDTGLNYVCDASNSRNKWLSMNEVVMFGEANGACNSGNNPNNDVDCAIQLGDTLGVERASNLGFYVPYPLTITGYGFSQDNDACSSGSFDLEVWSTGSNTDDNNYSLESTFASGVSTETSNGNTVNVDVAGDQYIIIGIDNNCGQTIDDWNLFLYFRWRS